MQSSATVGGMRGRGSAAAEMLQLFGETLALLRDNEACRSILQEIADTREAARIEHEAAEKRIADGTSELNAAVTKHTEATQLLSEREAEVEKRETAADMLKRSADDGLAAVAKREADLGQERERLDAEHRDRSAQLDADHQERLLALAGDKDKADQAHKARSDAVATREQIVADAEGAVARREQTVAEREAVAARKEQSLETREKRIAQASALIRSPAA